MADMCSSLGTVACSMLVCFILVRLCAEKVGVGAALALLDARIVGQKKSNWDAPPDAALAAVEPTANNPQLTFKARRIYVGNLPQTPPIDDKQLREFFDQVPCLLSLIIACVPSECNARRSCICM